MKYFPPPLKVLLGITGACNLSCRYCSAKKFRDTADIPTNEMLGIIDQIGQARALKIWLSGGEPLMRSDLFQLIERLRRYPINIVINTNATLISRRTANTLVKRFGIKQFSVSIDGDRFCHERQRGRGSFRPAVVGIENLVAVGASVYLRCTVTRRNLDDIETVAALGKSLKVNKVGYHHIYYTGNALSFFADLHISPSEDQDTALRIQHLGNMKKYKNFISGTYLHKLNLSQRADTAPSPQRRMIDVQPCAAATTNCAVRPDGVITPCEMLFDVDAGNVRREKFLKIWRHSPVLKRFRTILPLDLSSMPECVNCASQSLCFQGHRCYPYHYPGGVNNKALYCMKEQLR